MSTHFKSKGPELLIDLIDKTAAVLQEKAGLDKRNAIACAHAVADRMRKDWGGQIVYFPKGITTDVTERDLKIYEEFDGSNHEWLAQKYDLTVQYIYRVIKAVRAFDIAQRQADLFPDSNEI